VSAADQCLFHLVLSRGSARHKRASIASMFSNWAIYITPYRRTTRTQTGPNVLLSEHD
jgi:hypothetical protein